jgi:hypothetical protein
VSNELNDCELLGKWKFVRRRICLFNILLFTKTKKTYGMSQLRFRPVPSSVYSSGVLTLH